MNGAGVTTPTREYLYLGSQLLAKVENSTMTCFHHDHLSARVMSNTVSDRVFRDAEAHFSAVLLFRLKNACDQKGWTAAFFGNSISQRRLNSSHLAVGILESSPA